MARKSIPSSPGAPPSSARPAFGNVPRRISDWRFDRTPAGVKQLPHGEALNPHHTGPRGPNSRGARLSGRQGSGRGWSRRVAFLGGRRSSAPEASRPRFTRWTWNGVASRLVRRARRGWSSILRVRLCRAKRAALTLKASPNQHPLTDSWSWRWIMTASSRTSSDPWRSVAASG